MAITNIANIDDSGKRYAVNVGFFHPGKGQAWFDLDSLPVIDQSGALIVHVSPVETVVFAPGNWSGVSVKDRAPELGHPEQGEPEPTND